MTVTWRSRWTTDIYPGEARCRIEVRDDSGRVLARDEFGYATLAPGQGSQTQLEVPGVAASVEARCGPGIVFDGSSEYVFEDVEFIGSSVFANVLWSSDAPVGTAACAAIVTSAAGKQSVGSTFTLDITPRTDFSTRLAHAPEPGATGSFICEPYRSPEQSETRYWTPLLSANAA